jgi:hypothetical protein
MFETKICPLCSKELTLKKVMEVSTYNCPTQHSVPGVEDAYVTSHYTVECNTNLGDIQRIYIYPWSIDNFDNKARLYKYDGKWRFIRELPPIKSDTEENLLKRIKKLLYFL